jgi:serpin B
MTRFTVPVLAFLALAELVSGCVSNTQVVAPKAPPADKAEAVKGNNIFALDLYGRLRGREGNLFLSPASISTALAMTYAGARGETANQMASTLHFTLDQEHLHPALGALLYDLDGGGKKRGYQLSVANALWGQKGYPFLPEFVTLAHDNYRAGLEEVDFVGATEQARQTINAWVERQTQDKIKDLLQEGVLSSDTRLVLTNAIYFKGNWASQFPKDRTQDGPFQVTAQEKVTVPFMDKTEKFNYLDGGTFQALELPYVDKDLATVVLLPKKADGVADFEKTLTVHNLNEWLGKLQEHEVVVALPRFKMTSEFSLGDTLAAMGMPLAFSPAADFSGMDGMKYLFVSAVVHKAFVDVNEEGTEAAAATAVVAVGASSGAPMTPVFRADHPFVFLIRDRRSGSILFLGRVTDPRP